MQVLTHFAIRNIALIAQLELDFASNFTALTGETGAGKSLLLDALGLTLGDRADTGLIRHGEDTADVTATFTPSLTPALQEILTEHGLNLESNTLTLRRQLKREGGSKCWVNGTPVSASVLAQLGACMVSIQGQHGQQHLLLQPAQQSMLDSLARLQPQLAQTSTAHAAYHTARRNARQLADDVTRAEAEQETLTQWRQELDDLSPQQGEEEQLLAQRARLQHLAQLQQALTAADDALSTEGGSLTSLRHAAKHTGLATKWDATLQPLSERLDVLLNDLTDAAHTLARHSSTLEAEGNLEHVDDRLHALRSAARKHRCTVDELPAKQDEFTRQTTHMGQLHKQLQQALQQQADAQKAFHTACTTLTHARQQAYAALQPNLQNALKKLHLPHATLTISCTPLGAENATATGAEMVELLLSANPGQPPQPIAKVASGGELSRLMLALKSVLYQGQPAQTIIFDEIDTGLSGAAASAVGAAMATLAGGNTHQVLAITHHPQVAAAAQHHLRIGKQVETGQTTTTLTMLNSTNRLEELARLLSGSKITDQARAAAQALLSESQAA